jgi:alkanesulfonate monooxygenase SsuD/methylene tetrahydromethanopterin reductase-like flavin-dependent oxidoreductase (luciferase family)
VTTGLFLDLRNPPTWRRTPASHVARTLELVSGAEELGLGAVWCTEHHFFEDGYLSQPLVLAAALAARTRRLRIGTAVTLAPLRHPLHLAEEAATVDLVSGGRLELGLGAGYVGEEFEAFGAERERRMDTADAVVAEVRRLLDGVVQPGPLQRPVPLWLGYQGPLGARRAGRLGVGLLSLSKASLAPYLAGLAESGEGPQAARMAGVVDLILADDPERAADRVAPHYAWQRWTYRRAHAGADGAPPITSADDVRPQLRDLEGTGLLVCTPEEALAVLDRRLEGLPARHVYFWASVAGMPDDLVERHVELLCARIAPALAAGPAGGPGTPEHPGRD